MLFVTALLEKQLDIPDKLGKYSKKQLICFTVILPLVI